MNSALRLLCCFLLIAQAGTPPSPLQDSTTAVKTPVAACAQPCLEDGTPVRLLLSQSVSSADARVNDRVQFEVMEDVKVQGVVVIPKDGIAWGTVTEAQPKRRLARGGKLEIVMDTVRLTDGEKVGLRATKDGKGGDHKGAMTVGIVATGLVFFPVAPLFLLMHGKDITFPKGAEVPTFVDGNFRLDLSKFPQTASPEPTQGPTPAPAPVPTQTTPTQP